MPTAFEHLLPEPFREELSPHVPAFTYLLQDLSQTDDAALQGEALLRLVLLVLKHARRREFWQLPGWIALLHEVAAAPDGFAALVAVWRYITAVTPRSPPPEVLASLVDGLSGQSRELVMSWAEQLRDEGRQQGLEQGRLQKHVELLMRLIRLKFGEPSAEVVARVEAASAEQLDAWTERILTAETLEALFS